MLSTEQTQQAIVRSDRVHANSGSSDSLASDGFRLELDVDAGVGGIAFGGNASGFENQRLEIFRAGVLAGGGSGFARDIFFHQGAAVVVGAGVQAELRELAIQLYPRNLNVVDGAGEHDSRQRVNLQMLGQSRAGARESLMKEQGVLVNEAEGHEFGEASGLALDFAQAAEVD